MALLLDTSVPPEPAPEPVQEVKQRRKRASILSRAAGGIEHRRDELRKMFVMGKQCPNEIAIIGVKTKFFPFSNFLFSDFLFRV
jgi:hypothetical protein